MTGITEGHLPLKIVSQGLSGMLKGLKTISFVMSVLFALVLVSLDNIQEHRENPFVQIGQDDVSINAEKFVERLQAGATSQAA